MEKSSAIDAQVKIRLSVALRDRLKVSAAVNRRTLMREIEFRVMESMEREAKQRAARNLLQEAAA